MSVFFDFYIQHEQAITAVQLFVTMLGMGVTLTVSEFRDIARRPAPILWMLLLQFVAMPLLALGFGQFLRLPPEIVVGLVVVVSLPSGSLSNIFNYLGRGNVPLSITATCASTAACLVVTPLVLRVFLPGDLQQTVQMPVGQVVSDICLLLLLPLAIGMAIGSRFAARKQTISRWLVRVALMMLIVVVVGALGSGRVDVWQYPPWVPGSIIVFILITLVGTDQISRIWRLSADDRYTLAVEVCMRNCNLGYRLCAVLFPVAVGSAGTFAHGPWYVCLFSGGVMIVICGMAVARRNFSYHLRQQKLASSSNNASGVEQ